MAVRRKRRKAKKGFKAFVALLLVAVIGLGVWLVIPKTGWKKTDEGVKYIHPETKEFVTGLLTVKDKSYILDQNGILSYGLIDLDGKKYFADEKGVLQTGWKTVDGMNYYFVDDYSAANGLVAVDGKKYCFRDGLAVSGLILDGGKLYYGNENGELLVGSTVVDGVTVNFSESGSNATGIFTVGEDKYCFRNGEMQYEWQIVDRVRYYFGEGGKMLKNTDVGIYEIDANGVAKQAKAKPSNLSAYIQMYIDEYGDDEKGLFNAIKNNCSYKSADISIPAKETYEETACDAINQGHGVCWHLASLAYSVYKQAGYEVYYVRGNGLTYSYHEWIYVKFKEDGQYYHVDPSNWAGYKNTDTKMKERGYHTWEIFGFEG